MVAVVIIIIIIIIVIIIVIIIIIISIISIIIIIIGIDYLRFYHQTEAQVTFHLIRIYRKFIREDKWQGHCKQDHGFKQAR